MCNKTVNTSPSPIQFVTECYKNQEMCVKAVDSVLDQYNAQAMSDKAVCYVLFILKYWLDGYKIQKACDKAVDGFLSALKFFLDWFVKIKIIKKIPDALFVNDNIIFPLINAPGPY